MDRGSVQNQWGWEGCILSSRPQRCGKQGTSRMESAKVRWWLLSTILPHLSCHGVGLGWNITTSQDLDQSSWRVYLQRSANTTAQSCMFINETFSEWMLRRTSSQEFEFMAPYADRSAIKGYASISASYVRVPKTLAIFTWKNIRQIVYYPFTSSFAMKALHGHGMSILMVQGEVYRGLTRSRISESRLNPHWIKKQAIDWMKVCYECDTQKQYSRIRRGIIIEELVGGNFATEIRVYVFHGEPFLLEIREYVMNEDKNMERHINLIQNGKEALDMSPVFLNHTSQTIGKDVMRDLFRSSRDLTRNLPFVTVNFFFTGHELYFKELDFHPKGMEERLNEFYKQNRDTMAFCPRVKKPDSESRQQAIDESQIGLRRRTH